MRGLACAALSSGLRGILIFDLNPLELRVAAATLAQMLTVVTEHEVVQVTLGATETDDDLWGGLALSGIPADLPVAWQPSPLLGAPDDQRQRLALIPDLSHLSLAASRTCVMLIGGEVAYLERHGQQQRWLPMMCWLAGCRSDQVGRISPHLLDRFALRLSGRGMHQGDRASEILGWVSESSMPSEIWRADVPADLIERLRVSVHHSPKLTAAALASVLEYAAAFIGPSARREIALARLAHTLARIDGSAAVVPEHVAAAARLIQLRPQALPPQERAADTEWLDSDETARDLEMAPNDEWRISPIGEEPVYQSGTPKLYSSILLPPQPYPEDQAPIERESASLRVALPQYRPTTVPGGPIVGVERANGLHDLALVSTVLEALKFQAVRRRYRHVDSARLLFAPGDLRSYRRAPVAEQLLALLIDYTSLRGRDWKLAITPYLSWAYTERASVAIIQVGAAGTQHLLRAERVSGQNILVPRIGAALEASPGNATPLAHGLDLALHLLRHALQHSRGMLRRALFVVVSDGRGNVPLDASRVGHVTPPINREGIDDALQVAERIRGIDNVEIVFLNPQPQQHAELPLSLAAALGAGIVPIPMLVPVPAEVA
jgi:magnesium chelatase subunit D